MQALFKKFGFWGGVGAFAAYVGCCAYMFARQSHLLYQPDPYPHQDDDDDDDDDNNNDNNNNQPQPDMGAHPLEATNLANQTTKINSSTENLKENTRPSKFMSNISDVVPMYLKHRLSNKNQLGTKTIVVQQQLVELDGLYLSGWVDNPGQKKAIVYYGGSSEIIQLRRKKFSKFSSYTRYFIPYRGFWPNQQLTPNEAVLKEDAKKLFDFAQLRHQKVYVVGRSLGTSIALHVAANRKVEKLVLITPFYSILNLAKQRYKIFPVQKILRDWHEAHRDALLVENNVHVFLAQNDLVTPKDSWEQLKQHFKMPFKEKTMIGTDHTNIVDQDDLWDDIYSFFKQNLSKQKTKKQ